MSLFSPDFKTGEEPVDMNPDEVIDYLIKLGSDGSSILNKMNVFPYLEVYYEFLINSNNAADSYYTSLAQLYVEKVFELHPKQLKKPQSDKEPQAKEYRAKL
jgi:hypothetical protein